MSLANSRSKAASRRFFTREIQVGQRKIGGSQPLLIQSMTTTNTEDVQATIRQSIDLIEAGCEAVRITAPTVRDAEALKDIRLGLNKAGFESTPLIADIHFQPGAAMIAAEYVEKIRINPGNFADRKMFKAHEYSDEEYSKELKRVHDKFKPLVLKLKELGRALRIGTNHGSLSDRVMNRFGDTPLGMVESAFEYADICRQYDFHNFCFSMKASNVGVMIEAYRLLIEKQKERGFDYPIHLGVTEAGDGEDARLKSAIGIGTLLAEGVGDTIRVSLTEAAVKEIPVAQAIAKRFSKDVEPISAGYAVPSDVKRVIPEVWYCTSSASDLSKAMFQTKLRPDVILYDGEVEDFLGLRAEFRKITGVGDLKLASLRRGGSLKMEGLDYFVGDSGVKIYEGILPLKSEEALNPENSVLRWKVGERLEDIVELSYQVGSPFIDVPFSGILVEGGKTADDDLRLAYGVLQATRRRMSKTEYIACPSCGRTLFDLEETTARIKKITSHLKGVKIAVMGCIVNGPGEMADADFGYVGGAPGKVNLYVEKDCVERNITSKEAPDRLVDLIKRNGKWQEPEAEASS